MQFGWVSGTMLGLAACAAACTPRPIVNADSGWRTVSGIQLSIGEVEALRSGCLPRAASGPLDSADPVANPVRDNPVYHPGGEGLASAALAGLGDADRPLELGFRRTTYTAGAIDECLIEKGLVPIDTGRNSASLR